MSEIVNYCFPFDCQFGNDLLYLNDPTVMQSIVFPHPVVHAIFLFCAEGTVSCEYDNVAVSLRSSGYICIMPGCILKGISFGNDYKGRAVFMSMTYMDNLELNELSTILLFFKEKQIITLSRETAVSILNTYDVIANVMLLNQGCSDLFVKHQLLAIFYGISINTPVSIDTQSSSTNLYLQFHRLVTAECASIRNVEYYATKLGVSVGHLECSIKHTIGMLPLKYISSVTIFRAKGLLLKSTMTIKEIACHMNFGSQSDFGKYFKKHTGISPVMYRRLYRR